MELQAHEFNFDGLNELVYQQTEDGEHQVCFDPHRVIRSPYEIKDGKRIEQTVQGVDMIVTIFTLATVPLRPVETGPALHLRNLLRIGV